MCKMLLNNILSIYCYFLYRKIVLFSVVTTFFIIFNVEDDYIQEARQMKKDGKSFREIEKELNSKGYEVSKSSIQRRLD